MTEMIAIAMVIGILPGAIAEHKGYSFLPWWAFGTALFIVALPYAILMQDGPKKARPCPHCRTKIDKHASVCRQCGRDVAAVGAT